MWSAHDAQNWVLWIIDCPLWAHINHAGLVQWIDSNWAQRKLVICRKNLKCRCCPRGLRLCIFYALAHLYRKFVRLLFFWGSDSFFLPSRQIAGCISSGLLGALLKSLQRTVVFLCFPQLSPELSSELSMTSDESWCVADLTNRVLGHKKMTIAAWCWRSAQLNPSPASFPITTSYQLFSGSLQEPLNPQ